MTDVQVVQGVPGGGKTHTLREHVEAALRRGDSVRYLNFTNAGTVDTEAELAETLSVDPSKVPVTVDDPDDEVTVADIAEEITGTLHGLAYEIAREHEFINSKEQVMQPTDAPENAFWKTNGAVEGPGENLYQKFCREHALEYAVDPDTPMTAVLRDDEVTQHEYSTDGNAVFAAFEWARMRYPPKADRARQARQAPVDVPVPGERVEQLYERWEEFKRSRSPRRVEHADYVDAVIRHGWTPDADVLCIDEYQDLSPLEHRMLWEWMDADAVDEIILAGDTNQSVYSFRGARPAFMRELREDLPDTKVDVLSESRRCADRVAALAESLIDGLPGTVDISSHDSTGEGRVGATHTSWSALGDTVEGTADRYTPTDGDPAVMVLARSNRVAAEAAKHLKQQGIPFEVLGNEDADAYSIGTSLPAWRWETLQRVRVLRQVRDGKPVRYEQVETFFGAFENTEARLAVVRSAAQDSDVVFEQAASAAAVRAGFPDDAETVTGVIGGMDVSAAVGERMRGAVTREIPATAGVVKVGTVHAAKGLSAHSVLLLDAYPGGCAEMYGQDASFSEEERRVSYVAVTRARNEFQVVRGLRGDAPAGHREQWPTFRGFAGGENQ